MRVELDIYSGLSNPYWELSPRESREFRKLVEILPESQQNHSISEGLGYRGLIVTSLEDCTEGYEQVRIGGGLVLTRRGDNRETLADEARVVERWLLETGRHFLDRDLYAELIASVQPA